MQPLLGEVPNSHIITSIFQYGNHKNIGIQGKLELYHMFLANTSKFPSSIYIMALSALLLLVLGVFADNHDAAFAFDDPALVADGFDGRSDFHG